MPKKQSIKVGEQFKTKTSGMLEVLEYNGCREVKVRFLGTGNEAVARAENIRSGHVCDKVGRNLPSLEKGTIHPTARHGNVQVLEYRNCDEVEVLFIDHNKTKVVSSQHIRRRYITPH